MLADRLRSETNYMSSPRGYSIQKVFRRTKRSLERHEYVEQPLYLEMTETDSVPAERTRSPEEKEVIGAQASIRTVLSCMWLPCLLLLLVTYQTFVQIPGLVFLHNYR